jgi:hypothetical protein
MQCAYVILSSLVYPALNFFHITSKPARFLNKVIGYKMRVSIFSTNFVWNIFHYRKYWTRYDQNVDCSSCKVPFILVRFYWNLNFRKILQYKISQNRSIGSRVVPCGQRDRRLDGRTDMTNLIVTFRNFANAPTKATQTWLGLVWSPDVLVVSCWRLVACFVNTVVSDVYVTLLPWDTFCWRTT